MSEILVKPERLVDAAAKLTGNADQFRQQEQHLRRLMSELDWLTNLKPQIESRASSACQGLLATGERASAFGVLLRQTAQSYLEMDRSTGEQIARSTGAFQERLAADPPPAGTAPEAALPAGTPPGETPPAHAPAGPYQGQFDGTHPAPGTTNAAGVWRPTMPSITSDPSNRGKERYADVINQFAVGNNPRYTQRDSDGNGIPDTFCNFFVWDVTRAMGAPIPHWLDNATGEPYSDEVVAQASTYGAVSARASELNANATIHWIEQHGSAHGWREVPAEQAQAWANEGKPAMAAWDSHSDDAGHVAIVRPHEGAFDPAKGPWIAQAGVHNYNGAYVDKGFGASLVGSTKYFVHD